MENKKKYKKIADNNELIEHIQKSCKTIFVGAISKIEKHFGSLWSEDKDLDESQMTEDQKKWYNIFMNAREEIFDQGNKQLNKIVKGVNEFINDKGKE